MPDDLSDQVETAAGQPKSVSVDGRTVVGRDVEEIVKADKHVKSRDVVKRAFPGLAFGQINPPGAS